MELSSGSLALTLLDDPSYTPGSADNVRKYDREYSFVEEYRPVSQYSLVCRLSEGTMHSCILMAGGGATRVHEHSAVVVNGSCFIGVGDRLCSLALPSLDLKWATKVDEVTCFGVYYCPQHDCLLSHGELEIARVSMSGAIVWKAGGRDVFSEGFRVIGDHINAIDFCGGLYCIDIVTGRSDLIQGPTIG